MPKPLGWWTPIENGAFFTGLYAYALLSSPNPDPQELKNRLLCTLNGLKSCRWAVPTEREGMITNVWSDNHDWRGVVKLFYCARLLYELTGEKSALEEYIFLRDSTPKDWFFTRKEIASHGFSHDMVQQRSLVQSWIFTCAHLCLRELCRLDPDAAPDYAEGLRLNGITIVRMIDNMLAYDLDWRRLEPLWQPLGDRVQPAVDNALRMGEH